MSSEDLVEKFLTPETKKKLEKEIDLAKTSLDTKVTRRNVAELMAFAHPPPLVVSTFKAACLYLNMKEREVSDWSALKKKILSPNFVASLSEELTYILIHHFQSKRAEHDVDLFIQSNSSASCARCSIACSGIYEFLLAMTTLRNTDGIKQYREALYKKIVTDEEIRRGRVKSVILLAGCGEKSFKRCIEVFRIKAEIAKFCEPIKMTKEEAIKRLRSNSPSLMTLLSNSN